VAPAGSMYQAGTLSGNPLAMTAGLVTIRTLLKPGVFESIEQRASELITGIRAAAEQADIPLQAGQVGTMFGFYFLADSEKRITDYESAKKHANTQRYSRFFHGMLEQVVYFAPSQFEAGFMSSAHQNHDIQRTLSAVQEVFGTLG
jgi:glutamate-1-semialdehyde 2,1-aminomutase